MTASLTELPCNCGKQHPLAVSWQFHCRTKELRGSKSKSSSDWQGGISAFEGKLDSVEAFWATHLRVMQKAAHDQAIYMFKENVLPAWEDPAFEKGASVSIGFFQGSSREVSRACFELACARLITTTPGPIIGAGWVARTNAFRVELWSTSDSDIDLTRETRRLLEDVRTEIKSVLSSPPHPSPIKITVDFKPFSRTKTSMKAADTDFESIMNGACPL